MIFIRVLQIGDVHYTSPEKMESIADHKDRQYPAQVATVTTQIPMESSMRLLVEVTDRDPVDGIMMVGDLTDKGNLENYKKCIDYLIDNLNIRECPGIEAVHCVPGNHDIDLQSLSRTLNRSEDEIWDKFEPLKSAWKAKGLDVLATSSIETSTIRKGAAELEIVALNSCVGCGEYRGLSPKAGEALKSIELADEKTLWAFMEQLDTPSFASEHLEAAVVSIGSPANKLSLLLSHHNLLPQSVPVIAPYAGLLNAGRLRTLLTKGSVPVVYCHGHIHEDPIELVGCAHNQPSKLLTISAPNLSHGFNIIVAHFSDAGTPLGVEVLQFRISPNLTFSYIPQRRVSIPFRGPKLYLETCDEKKTEITHIILQQDGKFASALLREINNSYNDFSLRELVEVLKEMRWHGLVEIDNEDLGETKWRIRKA